MTNDNKQKLIGSNPIIKKDYGDYYTESIVDGDENILSSIKSVKSVYAIAQGSIYDLDLATNASNGVTITFKKNNTNKESVTIGTITAAVATAGTDTTPKTISAKVLEDKISEKLTATKLDVKDDNFVTTLSDAKNGWYYVKDITIQGIKANWMIQKVGYKKSTTDYMFLYTATNTSDPRVVLNSTDLTNWHSPYGSWHV